MHSRDHWQETDREAAGPMSRPEVGPGLMISRLPGAVPSLAEVAGNAATTQFLTVQREPEASRPPGPHTPDYSTMSWQALLPHASGKEKSRITAIDLHLNAKGGGTGAAPTLKYTDPANIIVGTPSAAPQGGVSQEGGAGELSEAQRAAFEQAQNQAIGRIVQARATVPARTLTPSPNNNAGFDYNPDKDPGARSYNAWAASALPTGVASKEDWNWQVFKRVQSLEGQIGRLTTYDKTLSVGAGFSSAGGATQRILGTVMALLPEVRDVAFALGLVATEKGEMSVVDTDRKWILDGHDAAAYVETVPALLSFIVNLNQGTQPVGPAATGGTQAATATTTADERDKQRQTFLDVQWQEFLTHTMSGMTSLVRGWPPDSVVLAVHAKHGRPANFPYTFWDTHDNPDLGTMIDAIFAEVGDKDAPNIVSGDFAKIPRPSRQR